MAEQDTSGFYKEIGFEPNGVYWAPNSVINKDFKLYKEDKDVYTYPVGEWYWFDSIGDACTYFDISLDDVRVW